MSASDLDAAEFAALFEAILGDSPIREGSVVRGTVTAVDAEHIVVDIGHSSAGKVRQSEFCNRQTSESEVPLVGDEIEVYLESLEGDDGLLVLSREKADLLKAWDRIQDAVDRDEVVEGVVVQRTKGGFYVDIGVKAFLPGSQVDIRPVPNPGALIGARMRFRIIKFNKRRGNIVLSRRVLLEAERSERRDATLERLSVGAVLDGVVQAVKDYGAFVDLGGIDGLLHVSEMSERRLSHPSEFVAPGDEVRVRVLKFDPEMMRISLRLEESPARREVRSPQVPESLLSAPPPAPPPQAAVKRDEAPPVAHARVGPEAEEALTVAPVPEPASADQPLPPEPLKVTMDDPFAVDDF